MVILLFCMCHQRMFSVCYFICTYDYVILLQVKPPNIGYKGKPPVTITGTNLGTVMDTITEIKVGSLDCDSINYTRIDDDFDVEINKE